MALATTCPQCKTSFKVVPDQLKLRRGLVRCGVCQHVFSGIDFLRYVDDAGGGVARPEGEAHRTPEPRRRASGRALAPFARARAGDRADRLDKPIERRADSANRRGGEYPSPRGAGDLEDDGRTPAGARGGPNHPPAGERQADAADEDFDNGPPAQFVDFEAIDPAPLEVDRPEALSADSSDDSSDDSNAGSNDDTSSDSNGETSGDGTSSGAPTNGTGEDDLKTEFFMADSEDGPFGRVDPGEVRPPPSIVHGAGHARAGDDDTDAEQVGTRRPADGEDSAGAAGPTGTTGVELTGADESAPAGAGESGDSGDARDTGDPGNAGTPEAGDGTAVGAAVSDTGLDSDPYDGEAGPDGAPEATGSRVRRGSRCRRTGPAAATVGASGRPGETAVAEPGPSKDGSPPSALDTRADADSTVLPEAAGEHVQSLAEWIDGRSEAAAARRLRRRSRRQAVEERERSADVDDATPTDDNADTGERRPRPRVPTARSTRFPALPDEDGMARRDAGNVIDGDSGLLSGLLSGRKRRNLIIGLTVLAVLQMSVAFRDSLAASVPFARPLLALLAAPLGLKIEPTRNIDQLSLEAFDIQDLGKNNQYMLSAIIRNSSGQALRWPAMELVLMDPSRNVVVRKVIEPETYLDERNRPGGIAPRSEQPIRLTIETRDVRMAGYNVALFYP